MCGLHPAAAGHPLVHLSRPLRSLAVSSHGSLRHLRHVRPLSHVTFLSVRPYSKYGRAKRDDHHKEPKEQEKESQLGITLTERAKNGGPDKQ